MPQLVDALYQIAFDVELLDIDKRGLDGQIEIALRTQVERIHLVFPSKRAPHAPLNAFGRNLTVNAQLVKYLQRFLRVANAP